MTLKLKRKDQLDDGGIVVMRIEVERDVRDKLKLAKRLTGVPVYQMVSMLVRQHLVMDE